MTTNPETTIVSEEDLVAFEGFARAISLDPEALALGYLDRLTSPAPPKLEVVPAPDLRECIRCGESRSIADFRTYGDNRPRANVCKPCASYPDAVWREHFPELSQAKGRKMVQKWRDEKAEALAALGVDLDRLPPKKGSRRSR